MACSIQDYHGHLYVALPVSSAAISIYCLNLYIGPQISTRAQNLFTDLELQAGLKRLKASLQTHPLLTGVHFSTNDVILALSWMLQCDAKGYTRPGEGPAGNTR